LEKVVEDKMRKVLKTQGTYGLGVFYFRKIKIVINEKLNLSNK